MKFGFTTSPVNFYHDNNDQLPMFAHGWNAGYEFEFWKDYIPLEKFEKLNNFDYNSFYEKMKKESLKIKKTNIQEFKMDIYEWGSTESAGIYDYGFTMETQPAAVQKQEEAAVTVSTVVETPDAGLYTYDNIQMSDNKTTTAKTAETDNFDDVIVDLSEHHRIDENQMVIVTFTTWKKRINNISYIIDDILKGTMIPDKICINLSVEDFPNMTNDFPQRLVDRLNAYGDIIEINWLSHNTKVWKKLIPTLCKYQDAIVISIDDDWKYPNDIVETLYKDFCRYDKKYPISGNKARFFGMNCHCGSGSLTTYDLLNREGQFDTLSEECMKYGSDDIFYSYCAKVNGNEYKQSSKMFFTNMKAFQSNDGFSNSSVDIRKTYDIAKDNYENNLKSDILEYICNQKNVIIDNYQDILKLLSNSTIKNLNNTNTTNYLQQLNNSYVTFISQIAMQQNSLKGKLYNNEKAIISLTSWAARIKYVGKTIYSLLVQCPEYHIVLVLSENEFPNKEKELPHDLQVMVSNQLFEILWVKENYKAFKKVLFTLDRYRCVPVISADDDCIYTCNYADMLYKVWEKNPASIVCNGIGNKYNFKWGNGPYTLYPPYCFKHYGIKCLNNEILSTNNDDAYYGVLLTKLNIDIKEIRKRGLIIFHDEKTPLGANRTAETVKNNFETINKNLILEQENYINLIGNSCVSGFIVKDYMLTEFSNPFCWNIIEYESMYNLIKYYDSINFFNYTLEFDNILKTYNVIIDNKVKVKYIHYIQDDNIKSNVIKGNNVYSNNIKKYVIEKYEERVKRMKEKNMPPVFLIAAGYTQGYYYTNEQLQSIIDIQSKYQLIISYDKCNITPNNNTIVLNHPYQMNIDGVHQKVANYVWNNILYKKALNKKYFSEILLLIKANNEKDFKDWIHWHLDTLKFEHLVVFDNESSINIKYICDSDYRIEYHYISGFPDQYKIYNQYVNNESNALWVFPIDDDEYLQMKNFDNVNDMLKYYQSKWVDMHKLSVRWKNMFPNDALAERNNISLMDFCPNANENWTKLFDGENKPVKTFVCTNQKFLYDLKTKQTHIPISIKTNDMAYLCNGERMKGNWYTGPDTDTDLKILHFQYKSKNEWIWKCQNRKRVSSKDTVGYNSKRVDIYKKMI